MATIALDRPLSAASQPEVASRRTAGDWSAMTDAEIMLRVREGDDVGFNFLIEKYRKPIINFMFRMVHNQAVAEETGAGGASCGFTARGRLTGRRPSLRRGSTRLRRTWA